jgi:hypothetical protein
MPEIVVNGVKRNVRLVVRGDPIFVPSPQPAEAVAVNEPVFVQATVDAVEQCSSFLSVVHTFAVKNWFWLCPTLLGFGLAILYHLCMELEKYFCKAESFLYFWYSPIIAQAVHCVGFRYVINNVPIVLNALISPVVTLVQTFLRV